MTRGDQPTGRDLVIAGGLALASAIAFGVTLAAVAAPKDLRKDLAAISAEADQASALIKRSRGKPGLERGQLCARAAAEEAQALQASLANQASQLRLTPLSLETRALEAEKGVGKLTPIAIRLEVSGAYPDAIALLDALAAAQPKVFADAVDLTSNTSTVTLTFSGRVFCSASA